MDVEEDGDDNEDDVVNISQITSKKQEESIKKQIEELKLQNKEKQTEYENVNKLKKELQSKLNEQKEIIEKKSTNI